MLTHKPFSVSCPAEESRDRTVWWVPGTQPRQAHQNSMGPPVTIHGFFHYGKPLSSQNQFVLVTGIEQQVNVITKSSDRRLQLFSTFLIPACLLVWTLSRSLICLLFYCVNENTTASKEEKILLGHIVYISIKLLCLLTIGPGGPCGPSPPFRPAGP